MKKHSWHLPYIHVPSSAAGRYMWTIPYGRTQLSQSSQSRKQPKGIRITQIQGPTLGWGLLHPFVSALPENLLCLQPAEMFPSHMFPGCCLRALQGSLISVRGKAFRSNLSGNLYLSSCFHMIYRVFSALFSWCSINLGYIPLYLNHLYLSFQ